MRSRLAVAASLLVLAGCGSGDGAPREPGLVREPSAGALEHVHGLASQGEDLLIATHAGLWRLGANGGAPTPVGESRRDLMGFTVADDGRFLASGHPALDEDAPPALGLTESRDGGLTWSPVSLEGKADFHVLRAAGKRVYGFDGHAGGLQVSADGGRTWKARDVPSPLIDLAVDVKQPRLLIATTEQGVFRSRDDGRSWKQMSSVIGLVAWDASDLVLVDAYGNVLRSADQGREFVQAGSAGAAPVAMHIAEGRLVVALQDGSIRQSTNGGARFDVRLPA
jgi:hypothetical protein